MSNIFKIYSKDKRSNKSDTIFSIIGRREPDQTKSLAFLLHYYPNFLRAFLTLIDYKINLNFTKTFITAEQKPDSGEQKIRRDIAIFLYYQDPKKNTLIVIEAKNLFLKKIDSISITNQISKYFDSTAYSDTLYFTNKIAIILTKEKIILKKEKDSIFNGIFSITWQAILLKITTSDGDFLNAYKQEIMSSNFIKTYEEEIFCPPVGDTFDRIQALGIYCCPAERSLREAIYLMPRLPVNKYQSVLTNKYVITDFTTLKGKGFCIVLYKIDNSFIVDNNSLESIEDEALRVKVKKWLGDKNESLKVFVLNGPMYFHKPKFTELINNTWNGYFKLSQVWGEFITKETD